MKYWSTLKPSRKFATCRPVTSDVVVVPHAEPLAQHSGDTHIYVSRSSGQTDRLSEIPTKCRAKSLDSAFDQGFALAVKYLTPSEDASAKEA